MTTDNDTLKALIEQLGQQMVGGFKALDDRIRALDERVHTLDERQRSDMKSLDDRLRAVEIVVAEIRGRVTEQSTMLQLVVASRTPRKPAA